MVPVLETERLTMRAFRGDDFPAFAAFLGSDRARYYGGPLDRVEAWRKMAVYAGHWSLRGYGPWALEERGSGAFVGLCGPWFPEGWPEREISYGLANGAEGRGLATEAVRAALAWAFGPGGWTTAISAIHPDNAGSIGVATRNGAVFEGLREVRPHGMLGVYRYPGVPS